MSKKETEEVYTLLLTSSNTNSNKQNNPIYRDPSGNLANIIWEVDYDTLFRGRQQLFKHCRVRFNLMGAGGTYTYDAQTGYLCANFATNYNAQTTYLPCILGLLHARTNPNSAVSSAVSVYTVSTLQEVGVDINLTQLQGRQNLNLRWTNDDGYSLIGNITADWQIMLEFTLYN
jgi:hypothetical protein